MANYTFLTVCDSDVFPASPLTVREEYWSPYPPQRDNPPWYEAKYTIPLFWLCLFSPEHLLTVAIPPDPEEESAPPTFVPFLLAPQPEAVANGQRRRPLLEQMLSSRELQLYDAFILRVQEEFFPFPAVLLEEVAAMDDEGIFKEHIAEALWVLDTLSPDTWSSNFSFVNVTGLDERLIQKSSWYSLVGYDNHSHWPEEPEPTTGKEEQVSHQTLDSHQEEYHRSPLPDLSALKEAITVPGQQRPFVTSQRLECSEFGNRHLALFLIPMGITVSSFFISFWLLPVAAISFLFYFRSITWLSKKWLKVDFEHQALRRGEDILPFEKLTPLSFAVQHEENIVRVIVAEEPFMGLTLMSFTGAEREEHAKVFIAALWQAIREVC